MPFFKTENQRNFNKTTKGFIIGYPEAEAEANNASEVKLCDIFRDYLGILNELNGVKFIISGRKGCGKTAIGEHIISESQNEPNLFSLFIRKNDLNLEKIVQIGLDEGQEIENELLFKWIILIKLLKLIANNEAVQNKPEIKILNRFLKKNSGFVDINEYEIKQHVKKNGFDINIEQFRRFTAKLNQEILLTGEKAPFYKLLPYLQDAIIALLKKDSDNENRYILIFDDLDINFKAENKVHIANIANLVRIAKDYNNNVFSKNKLEVKIIILLRDDIVKEIELSNADTAKIISSYTIKINWWESYKQENETNIKKFINNRLAINFQKKKLTYDKSDPWETLFDDTDYHPKTSFKYVLDHTFFRPRDLILFFKPISDYNFKIPLTKAETNILLGDFASEFIKELKNELDSHFSKEELTKIFNVLLNMNLYANVRYDDFIDKLNDKGIDNPESVTQILFDYSLIGNIDTQETPERVEFKYRQKANKECCINQDLLIIFHYSIRVFKNNNHIR